jgi:hypothetical protein
MQKPMACLVTSGLLFLGACASGGRGPATATTAASTNRFSHSYKPYVKRPELFVLLKGDYGRLSERHGNYWEFCAPGFSIQQVRNLYFGNVDVTAPEPLPNVRKGYAEDFKEALIAHFRGKGGTVDNSPSGLTLEANLWRLDDTPGGRIWIPFNFGQSNAAFGVEMKVTDRDGKLMYAMVYDCLDFSVNKGFNKFFRDLDRSAR